MRNKVLLAILVMAAVWLFWRWLAPDHKEAPRSTETVEEAEPAPDKTEPVYIHRERPALPALAVQHDQGKPVERMEFNRSPGDPRKESRESYDLRIALIDAFERFREESGVSDEKAQALLMLMNDFRETEKILSDELWSHAPFRSDGQFEYWLRRKSAAWRWLMWETSEALEDMLTPKELRIWWDTVERESPWIRLKHWPDDLLVPAKEP